MHSEPEIENLTMKLLDSWKLKIPKKSLENSNESASTIDLRDSSKTKTAWKDHIRPPCMIFKNYKKNHYKLLSKVIQ